MSNLVICLKRSRSMVMKLLKTKQVERALMVLIEGNTTNYVNFFVVKKFSATFVLQHFNNWIYSV